MWGTGVQEQLPAELAWKRLLLWGWAPLWLPPISIIPWSCGCLCTLFWAWGGLGTLFSVPECRQGVGEPPALLGPDTAQ